jgi:putative ABC transport system permease protein
MWGESIPESFAIVGIVGDVKFLGPAASSEPAFYLPTRQFPSQQMVLLVRTEGDPALLSSRLREEVWALDADLPISNITTMETLLTQALAQPRTNTLLLGLFGTAALALAAMGIYGLVSYSVARRTNEIGIRMALGAQAKEVTGMVVGQGIGLTLAGLLIGVAGALALGRVMSSLLFGVRAADPTTFAVVACFLVAVAVLASYVPARRATRIDPISALRYE